MRRRTSAADLGLGLAVGVLVPVGLVIGVGMPRFTGRTSWTALLGPIAVVAVAVALLFVGVWAAGVVVRRKGSHDPQIVVIDEVVGVLLTLAALPPDHGLRGIVLAFVLFRIFDQFKPFPARRAESLPRGWGVMMDDVFAGIWGVGVVVLLRVFAPHSVFA